MIAKWIAGALLRGEDHLRLSKEELVEWQLQGCRVSNGSPHNLWGQYARMHVGKIRLSLLQRLMEPPHRTVADGTPVGLEKMADLQWSCRRWRPVLRLTTSGMCPCCLQQRSTPWMRGGSP